MDAQSEWVDILLTLALTLIGLVQGSKWFFTLKDVKIKLALEMVSLGVSWAYRNIVKPNRVDGQKLDPDIALKAREEAKQKAIEYGAAQGIDVKRILRDDRLDHYLESEVNIQKLKGGKL